MKKIVLALSLIPMLLFSSFIAVTAAAEERPFPQQTPYFAGTIQPNNVSQAQMDSQVASFYSQWKSNYLVAVSGSNPVQKYVFYNKEGYADPANAVSCSEGHGYGMVITALMAGYDVNAQADFDALYRFYKVHPSSINPALMAWQQVKDGSGNIVTNPSGGADSATDGDLDIAYALLLADKQWGSNGAINYKSAALASIQATMDSVVNPSEWILKLGDWASNNDGKFGKATRPSDFMLSHFKAFAAVDTVNSSKWNNVLAKACAIVNYQYNSGGSKNTGLVPDFMVNPGGNYVPATGQLLESSHDGDYGYNSCRTPWRLAVDYLLTGGTAIKAPLMALNSWIKNSTGGDPAKIVDGYYVQNGTNGNAYGRWNDMCFTAPFAVSAMIDSSNQAWLNSLWNNIVNTPISDSAYYGNSIKMLVMITVSANWWTPVSDSSAISAFSPIEAESFSSQLGLETESCSDTGGGLNIGYIQNGDYAVYANVDFGSGATGFNARVASANSGGTIEIRLDGIDGPLVGTCVVPGTGGWQNWVTVNCNISGASGIHDLYLKFTGGSGDLMNVNWFKFIPVATSAFSPIEAENFSSQSGLEKESCSDTGGGLNIGYIQNGDYAVYANVDFGSGVTGFSARVASANSGGTIEIRLDSVDGPLVGTCVVPGTGGWQNWVTVNVSISGGSGIHDLYLKFTGGSADLMNVNWFKFL